LWVHLGEIYQTLSLAVPLSSLDEKQAIQCQFDSGTVERVGLPCPPRGKWIKLFQQKSESAADHPFRNHNDAHSRNEKSQGKFIVIDEIVPSSHPFVFTFYFSPARLKPSFRE
jgi:hypothetical protein